MPMIEMKDPLVVVYEDMDGKLVCGIHPREDYDHKAYGILICDLVQHVANAFDVRAHEVWEWVDKERFKPTDNVVQEPDGTWGELLKRHKQ